MPTPPDVGFLNRFIFDHPWTLGGFLLVLALGLVVTGLRRGNPRRIAAALIPGIAGAIVLVAGYAVVTAGERADALVRELVAAVEGNDLVGAADLIAEDGSVAFGSVDNPGFDKDFIVRNLSWIGQRQTITEQRILDLDAYTIDRDEGEVHMRLRTESDRGYGPAVTDWVITVRRRADGEWRVQRITWIALQGRAVDGSVVPVR